MAEIGTFGRITFETSSEKVLTWRELRRKISFSYAAHDVLEKKQVLQFAGKNLKEISIPMRLDASLGINPKNELNTLEKIALSNQAHNLIIGGVNLGKYIIEEIEEVWKHTDHQGHLLIADVYLRLKEYN